VPSIQAVIHWGGKNQSEITRAFTVSKKEAKDLNEKRSRGKRNPQICEKLQIGEEN